MRGEDPKRNARERRWRPVLQVNRTKPKLNPKALPKKRGAEMEASVTQGKDSE